MNVRCETPRTIGNKKKTFVMSLKQTYRYYGDINEFKTKAVNIELTNLVKDKNHGLLADSYIFFIGGKITSVSLS
jgi:hypothetical protein